MISSSSNPCNQDATYFPSDPQPSLADSTWQTWDALNGGWWSVEGTAGAGPGTNVKPLSAIIAAEPDATIVNTATGQGGFRVATGYGTGAWDNFVGNADAVTIGVSGNSTTYDFELTPPPPPTPPSKDACKKGGWVNYTDHAGRPFASQGVCVSYFATGGKNKAKG